jgi:hypothetical protein
MSRIVTPGTVLAGIVAWWPPSGGIRIGPAARQLASQQVRELVLRLGRENPR